jgi:DNA-binding NarL/FixJ family response regulator
MERELSISYPTVRNRVEALVRALGLADEDAQPIQESDRPEPLTAAEAAVDAAELTKGEVAARRQEILEALAAGRMDAADAATQIRALGKGV